VVFYNLCFRENSYSDTNSADGSTLQSAKAEPKIEYKIQSKYKGKLYEVSIKLILVLKYD